MKKICFFCRRLLLIYMVSCYIARHANISDPCCLFTHQSFTVYFPHAEPGIPSHLSTHLCLLRSLTPPLARLSPHSWLCTCSPSWNPRTSSRPRRRAATGESWQKTTCCGERSAEKRVSTGSLQRADGVWAASGELRRH